MPETAAPGLAGTARLQALADQCVQCGLCLPHCPTYRLDACESESPRGRIAYMKALAGGQFPATALGDLHLDHCLGCRRCEAVCPADVRYGALLVGSRARQVERAGLPWRSRVALGLMARRRWLGRALRLYRAVFPLLPASLRPLPRPPARGPTSRQDVASAASGQVEAARAASEHFPRSGLPAAAASLFVGCVAEPYEAPARAALLRLLAAAGVEGSIPAGQACCGAAARHAGAPDQAAGLAATNQLAFAGAPVVLCLASGCQETLSDSLQTLAPVDDALSFLAGRADALRFRDAGGRRVALHLPCTQRAVIRSAPALRALLARVPGLDLVEAPDTGCCGAAGLHAIEHPARADALAAPLLDWLAHCGATELLSANIGCRLHLARAAGLPVRHPLELLAEHLA